MSNLINYIWTWPKLLLQSFLPEHPLRTFAPFALLAALLAPLLIHRRITVRHRGRTPKFQPNPDVQRLFERRLASKWFRFKIRCLVPLWSLCNFAARFKLRHDEHWEDNWEQVLTAANYSIVIPPSPFMALGYACKKAYRDPVVFLGIEAPVAWLGPLRNSAIDHELMHCVQDYFVNLFNREALGDGFLDGDLLDPPGLVAKLKQSSRDRVSLHIRTLLHHQTIKALDRYPATRKNLNHLLLNDLNRLISAHPIFQELPFESITLRHCTSRALSLPPRLNRLLLEDAYPTELSRKRALTRLQWAQYEFFAILAGPLWLGLLLLLLSPIVKWLFLRYSL